MEKKKSRNNLRKKSVYENIKRNKKKLKSSKIQINKSVHLLKENSFSNLYQNSNLKKAKRLHNILNKGYFSHDKENIVIEGLRRKSIFIKNKKSEKTLKISKIYKDNNIKKIKEDGFKMKMLKKKNKKKLCHLRKISENNMKNIYLNEHSLKSASLDSQNFMILKWKSKETNNLDVKKKNTYTEKKNVNFTGKKIISFKNKKSISKNKKKNFYNKNASMNTQNLAGKIRDMKKSFKNKYLKRYSQNRKSLNKFKVSFKNKIFDQINKSTNFYTDRKISKKKENKNKKSLVNLKKKKKNINIKKNL